MDKPLDLKIEDAKNNIVDIINKSDLPAFLLEPILKDIYNEILIAKKRDLEKSKEKYLSKEEKDEQN